ncbi:MurR/RpiR family transcriptional regulator [Streptococcus sp. IMAU 99161]|uniref:MurR/RpiR family transcriptional regulator n=1 Tax=Streptococcus sp. IMAU 99161 TaxID=2710601 RepID=UPI001655021B|nr:MurR/RpiR family transcriptional regulator [Streptococcus sp. IMAU 99161]MBC8775763.1 MurR/RpiR family transcriptional regulator [Streptococcus sp. IMAU 99161]
MKQDQDLRMIIASHETELTDMERDIAHYFLSSEARQHSLSSSRVTKLLHVSKAALTRFSQKCGFTGYREFVYHFNEEAKNQQQEEEHDELTLSVLQRYHHISNVTENFVKDPQLEHVADLIDQADRVYYFGIGSSSLVAREMKLRLMRLGVAGEVVTDQDGFTWTTSILDSSCLVLGFSLSGKTNAITDSLVKAKENGAKTVLVTANPACVHHDFTEVVPAAPLPSNTYIDRISAVLPLLIVVDLIYTHFLSKNRDEKETVFNRYWENKKLSGQRSRKS